MNGKVTTKTGFVLIESGPEGDTRVLPDFFETGDEAIAAAQTMAAKAAPAASMRIVHFLIVEATRVEGKDPLYG